jgi:hypothetical protein
MKTDTEKRLQNLEIAMRLEWRKKVKHITETLSPSDQPRLPRAWIDYFRQYQKWPSDAEDCLVWCASLEDDLEFVCEFEVANWLDEIAERIGFSLPSTPLPDLILTDVEIDGVTRAFSSRAKLFAQNIRDCPSEEYALSTVAFYENFARVLPSLVTRAP